MLSTIGWKLALILMEFVSHSPLSALAIEWKDVLILMELDSLSPLSAFDH